jgi:hypothetical protein
VHKKTAWDVLRLKTLLDQNWYALFTLIFQRQTLLNLNWNLSEMRNTRVTNQRKRLIKTTVKKFV